jgi:hypothetical protein
MTGKSIVEASSLRAYDEQHSLTNEERIKRLEENQDKSRTDSQKVRKAFLESLSRENELFLETLKASTTKSFENLKSDSDSFLDKLIIEYKLHEEKMFGNFRSNTNRNFISVLILSVLSIAISVISVISILYFLSGNRQDLNAVTLYQHLNGIPPGTDMSVLTSVPSPTGGNQLVNASGKYFDSSQNHLTITLSDGRKQVFPLRFILNIVHK